MADGAREPQTLGGHIRWRRLALRLTQKQASARMGASPATVLNWEKGQSEPAAANMPAIAQFLGYSPPTASRSVPALLAAKRRELGWTQKTAANRLGVDPSTWGGWERGQVILRKDHREMVAQFIGVPAITLGKEMKARWNHFHQKPTGPGL